ncbi:MAG: mandelate racemase/muconate lactonizing enzyme family protein [Candidatus Nanopelagicales bacterium]|nr:mandelate racemase/muconate lactonizing enzyme family protein [Candidatus Nanopelagicales bacterium]MCF8536367.1 mandelate racemase/muconate lactonizing enzyme family protein [Candidatus Nanopelagicales bacterium]MCF8541553.1 mandelate racemase/muconate lactonizing enzyme family protein [Candidatus Nanopelagicales bacterium]
MVTPTAVRIARLEAWTVPYAEPNDHDVTRCVTLVRITTTEGVEGWGECVTLFTEAAVSCTALIHGWRDFLVGVEATPEAVLHAIQAQWWWYGVGGIASFALAGIDIAIWDALSRARGVSLLEAIGGPAQRELPVFVSSHAALSDLGAEAERWATWVAERSASGVKVGFGKRGDAHLGFDHDRDLLFMGLLREAVGVDTKICIDLGVRNRWTVDESVRRVRALEAYGLHWIEEPLGHDNPAGYRHLKDSTATLIAYGEREWTVSGIRRIAESGTVDVVGIDPGRVQGVSGFLEAADFLTGRGVQANAHAFSGPIIYAAGVALSLATPACRQIEVTPRRNQLFEILEQPIADEVDGKVRALTGPGLGIRVDASRVVEMALPD